MSFDPTSTDDPLHAVWHDRLSVLANGDLVPLPDAASSYGLLHSYLRTDWLAWDPLPLLREACLGHTLDPEQRQELVRARVLTADGSVAPAMRSVVLSAVRGDGPHLRLDSPFTDPVDRVLAEYHIAREAVRSLLDPAQATAFLRYDPAERALEEFRAAAAGDESVPPAEPESYARRVIRLAEERKKNPPPASPPSP